MHSYRPYFTFIEDSGIACNAMIKSMRCNTYLSSNFSNLVQPVHHVVQKLQLLIAQAAEVQWARSLTCLDNAGDVLHKGTKISTATTNANATVPISL